MSSRLAVISCLFLLFSLITSTSSACSVCYGDPSSPMVQGAKAGIILMIFVIYGVLMLGVGVVGFWTYRAKQLRTQETETPD